MEKFDSEKVVELEGKRVFIRRAPATVAFDVALKYSKAFQDFDTDKMQECLYILLRYADIDLGDNRRAPLDDKNFINQHFQDPKSLMTLQTEVVKVNVGFLAKDAPSNS